MIYYVEGFSSSYDGSLFFVPAAKFSLCFVICAHNEAAVEGDVMTSTEEEDVMPLSEAFLNKKRYSTDSISLFGVDLTADNVAVAMVYFVQGVLGLSRLAVSFYMKDDLHLDPAEVLKVKTYLLN